MSRTKENLIKQLLKNDDPIVLIYSSRIDYFFILHLGHKLLFCILNPFN